MSHDVITVFYDVVTVLHLHEEEARHDVVTVLHLHKEESRHDVVTVLQDPDIVLLCKLRAVYNCNTYSM